MHDFLENRLPKETLQRIAMDSLKLTNKSFTPRTGKNKHSDLIYATTIDGQDGYLYINLEHQSKEEKYMPLRPNLCVPPLTNLFLGMYKDCMA